LGSRNNPKNYG